jgi:hypothetical protein
MGNGRYSGPLLCVSASSAVKYEQDHCLDELLVRVKEPKRDCSGSVKEFPQISTGDMFREMENS